MIGNKQESIKQDYLAINQRSHIHNLRGCFLCTHHWRMHSSPILFLQRIDFLPACSLSLAFFFNFFLRGAEKEPLWHTSRSSYIPKAAQGNQRQRKALRTLGKGWFLQHLLFQTPPGPQSARRGGGTAQPGYGTWNMVSAFTVLTVWRERHMLETLPISIPLFLLAGAGNGTSPTNPPLQLEVAMCHRSDNMVTKEVC